ncbi:MULTISPECIES: hypothetical protein [unclassified Enterobacter]|uniref:hypothetical protein n=1 Tax=unclassified Enterobacter TaxID=2608935 RepID=UPI001618C6E5|nr:MULTISPECIES: hypothetical protein [unclassified Enterobacter]
MKVIKLAVILAALSGVSYSVNAIASQCTPQTQDGITCVCFPAPVGCIDANDPGNRP